MGKRKLPFGYAMENGDVKAEAKESGCVNWIYMTYHAGASLQEIASELNAVEQKHGRPHPSGSALLRRRYISGDRV